MSGSGIIRIGSRGSQLALWQAHHVAGLLRGRGQRQIPLQLALRQAERAEKALKAVEYMLPHPRLDLSIGEQPLQLARPRPVEAEPDVRADQRRRQAGTQR